MYANRPRSCRQNDFDVCKSTKIVLAKRPRCMRINLYAKRPTSGYKPCYWVCFHYVVPENINTPTTSIFVKNDNNKPSLPSGISNSIFHTPQLLWKKNTLKSHSVGGTSTGFGKFSCARPNMFRLISSNESIV